MDVPVLGALWRSRDKRVHRRLLHSEDVRDGSEDIVDDGKVYHHWVLYTVPVLESLLATWVLWLMLDSPPDSGWFFLLIAGALVVHAALKSLQTFFDVFVITNLRVFRISGLGPTKYASTPLSRILDITVDQTSLGQLLGYAHFTFESAAQDQGLRDVRFVPRPLLRDRMIQRQQLRLLRSPRRDH